MPASGRRYRPPAGLPEADDRRGRWQGVAVAIALHALVLLLVLTRTATTPILRLDDRTYGVRGAERGGGGGGEPMRERLQYIQAAAPLPPPVVRRPRPQVVPRIVPPRVPPPRPVEAPTPLAPSVAPPTAVAPDGGSVTTGPGTGAGPGTGGGVGTGAGAGVGNGVGPGTGGTPTASKVKAYPIELPAAGLDAPHNIRPSHLDAVFEVTEHGDARLLSFTQTNDGGFNRRLRDELSGTRFHAAALPNGTPVRDTVQVSFDLQ